MKDIIENKHIKRAGTVTTVVRTLDRMEKGEQILVKNNPYYTHMPKNDPIAATKYAAEMGGEHFEITKCSIF